MSGKGKDWAVIFWNRFFRILIPCASMPESIGGFSDIIGFCPNAFPSPFITNPKPMVFSFMPCWTAAGIPRGFAPRCKTDKQTAWAETGHLGWAADGQAVGRRSRRKPIIADNKALTTEVRGLISGLRFQLLRFCFHQFD